MARDARRLAPLTAQRGGCVAGWAAGCCRQHVGLPLHVRGCEQRAGAPDLDEWRIRGAAQPCELRDAAARCVHPAERERLSGGCAPASGYDPRWGCDVEDDGFFEPLGGEFELRFSADPPAARGEAAHDCARRGGGTCGGAHNRSGGCGDLGKLSQARVAPAGDSKEAIHRVAARRE